MALETVIAKRDRAGPAVDAVLRLLERRLAPFQGVEGGPFEGVARFVVFVHCRAIDRQPPQLDLLLLFDFGEDLLERGGG